MKLAEENCHAEGVAGYFKAQAGFAGSERRSGIPPWRDEARAQRLEQASGPASEAVSRSPS